MCVDFSISNGNTKFSSSYHYSTKEKKSKYEEGMSESLNILMDYDYDKKVQCYGLGAEINHPCYSSERKV